MAMGEKRKRIAVMVDYLTSEYSEELLAGVSKCCEENDVDLLNLVCGELRHHGKDASYQYVSVTSLVRDNLIDGVIFTSGTQMHHVSQDFFVDYVNRFNIPATVNVSALLPGIHSVVADGTKSFSDLVEYLIKNQNSKKILFMGVNSTSSEVVERTKAFYEVIEKCNIPKENVVQFSARFDYPSAMEQLNQYYNEHNSFDFDTIIALNDDMAFACIDFCQNIGLSVPNDVVVSGFDDLPRSSFSHLPLTTINQNLRLQGYTAAQMVIDLIDGKDVPYENHIPANVVLRESTNRIFYSRTPVNNELFHIELDLLLQKNKKYSVYEWFVKRNQLYDATKFYTDIEQNMSLAQLKKILNRALPRFDIKKIVIVMYETTVEKSMPFDFFDLPSKAKVLTAFDKDAGYVLDIYDESYTFNPQENLVPPELEQYINKDMVCISLFKGTTLYGYMIFNKGRADMTVYDILAKSVSSLIASVFSYTVAQHEQQKWRERWIKTDLMASTDELTGIKNRRYFFDIGTTTMTFAETVGQEGLVIFCDMDGLKKINDTFGHDVGDHAIKSEAQILVKNFRTNDVVARIAGDEFAIICHGITLTDFNRIKKNIEKDCEKWSIENNSPFKLSISMGAQVYPSPEVGYDLEKLLSLADKTLYEVKKAKKAKQKS